MSFIGSVPPEARIVIKEILDKIHPSIPIYIGCSGNFVIDRICSSMGRTTYSNDVALYSKAIADIAMGVETELEVTEHKYRTIFGEWEESKYKKLAMIMYIAKISEFEDCGNDFKAMQYHNMIENNKEFYLNTKEKLERQKSCEFNIDGFFFGDFREHLSGLKEKGVGMLFAPTYTGGYEKMYKRVEEVFNYERASYQMFDTKECGTIYEDMLKASPMVIHTDQDLVNLQKYLVARTILGNGKKDILTYSSVESFDKHMFLDSRKYTPIKRTYEIMPEDFEFTEKTQIRMIECKTSVVNHYKHVYMGAKVDYSEGGDFGILFFADGLLFGLASISKFLGCKSKRDIFLQSDFCVPHYTKLSKLTIMLLLSLDVQDLILDKFAYMYEGLQTSVYTDKAVSMKYRGVFTLEEKDTRANKLTYRGSFKNLSVKSLYREWLQKEKILKK